MAPYGGTTAQEELLRENVVIGTISYEEYKRRIEQLRSQENYAQLSYLRGYGGQLLQSASEQLQTQARWTREELEQCIQKDPVLRKKQQQQKQTIQKLRATIKRLRKGQYMRSDFFNSKNVCLEHREYKCLECETAYQNTNSSENSNALMIVTSSLANDRSSMESEDMQLRFRKDLHRKKRFIQKALNKTDEQIKKTKVKDLPKLVSEAKEEITVGGMEDLLEEDTRESGGIMKGIARFFLKGIHI